MEETKNAVPDSEIVALFIKRDEDALRLTGERYGAMLRGLALRLTGDPRDAEECFNDALSALWNRIPPEKPEKLGAYAARIARNLALKKKRERLAVKRGGGLTESAPDELENIVSSPDSVGDMMDAHRLREELNAFLRSLDKNKRAVFVRRYWFGDSVARIAEISGFSQSKIKMILSRTKRKLKKTLEKEGLL